MAIIWCNVAPSVSGGGPSVWAYKMFKGLKERGHKVIFSNPQNSDIALCVINVGKAIKQIDRNKTKIMLRSNGIYNKLYNEKFDRKIRPDMTALHNDLKGKQQGQLPARGCECQLLRVKHRKQSPLQEH